MAQKREMLWIVVGLFFLGFLFQYFNAPSEYVGATSALQGFSSVKTLLTYLFTTSSICTLVSGVVYAFLLYQGRELNLFLILLQWFVLLVPTIVFGSNGGSLIILGWMMLLTVVSQSSRKKNQPALRSDLLDDMEKE